MDPSLEKEETKMSEKDVDVDEGDNDTEDKEEAKALFDQPLVLEGKRKRKSTELFAFGDKDKRKYTGGKGVRLGDIPFVEHNITRFKADQLKVLFKLCYDRTGTRSEIKRSLRDFSGFTEESKELLDKKRATLERMTQPALKLLCDTLGIDSAEKKEDTAQRIMDFLDEPVDSGKVVRKRRTSSTGQRSRKKSKPSESDGDNLEDEEQDKDEEGEDKMDTTQSPTTEVKDTVNQQDEKVEPVTAEEKVENNAEQPQDGPAQEKETTETTESTVKEDEEKQPTPVDQQQQEQGAVVGSTEE